jgi:small-conductance mechanosensitive channel/CRP-like cAMP-binding protein
VEPTSLYLLFDHQLTAMLALPIAVWIIAKNLPVWAGFQKRCPLCTAVLDLCMAPLTVVLAFAVLQAGVRAIPGGSPAAWFPFLFNLVLCLITGWYFARAIDAFMGAKQTSKQGRRLSNPMSGLIRRLTYGACLFFGIGAFVWIQGYSLTGMWVSTGMATALAALALQQTLSDFFAGVALSMEGSIRIGDYLRLADGIEGKVLDINWRSTWLLDWDNSTHIVPNAKLAAQGVKNLHNERHIYRPWYTVQISAEIDPRFAKELLFEAVFRCKHLLKYPAPVVRLTDGSTVPYTYMIWVAFPNYPAMFRGREELYREIHNVLKRAGAAPSASIQEWRTRKAEHVTAEPPTIPLALKSQDLFSTLDDEHINMIALASTQLHYDANSTILLEGDCRDALDIITSGVVEARIKLPNGALLYAAELTAGDYFGLVSMFTHQPSFFEYTAQTDVTLVRVNMECMQELLQNYPELADYYASIIKQRIDDAELLQMSSLVSEPESPYSLNRIKKIIRKRLKKQA